jgi:hypothetical protein
MKDHHPAVGLTTRSETAMYPSSALTTLQSTPDTMCRLFFVVNKMDVIRTSEGLGENATRQYVAQLVTQQLSAEGGGFQLQPEQVLLQCPPFLYLPLI